MGTTGAVARIVWGLVDRPCGWRLEAIRRELGVSDRTLDRYLKACRESIVDRRGRPLIEIDDRNGRRFLRIVEPTGARAGSGADVLPLYFTLVAFLFLDRAGFVDGLDDLWARVGPAGGPGSRPALGDLRRKLYTLPQGLQGDHGLRDRLLTVLEGVIEQRRLRVDYEPGVGRPTMPDTVDPYTVAVVEGRLHLVGRCHGDDRIVRLPLEAIRAAALTDVRFEYPKRYTPERYVDGLFGAGEAADEVDVSLLVRGAEALQLVRSRRLHASQRFIRQQGQAAVLSMRVACSDDLKRWIVSLGSAVEVMAPRALRDDVRQAHRAAAALYGD